MSNESVYELTIVNMYMLKAKTEKKIITDYILKDVEPGMKSIGAPSVTLQAVCSKSSGQADVKRRALCEEGRSPFL